MAVAALRTAAYWGRARPDMTGGCPERADWEFFRFIWGFNRVYRAKTEALLDGCGKRVYRFHSRNMCARFLSGVEAE